MEGVLKTGNRSQGAGVRGQESGDRRQGTGISIQGFAALVWIITVIVTICYGVTGNGARIEPEGEAFTLTYTDFEPGKTLETTSDLQTWHSVIIAGELAPREIALTLSNKARAQFYRLR